MRDRRGAEAAIPAALIDRLSGRLGAAAVYWLAPRQAALPEAQQMCLAANEAPAPDWSSWPPDAWAVAPPLRLLAVPERLAAVETDARGRPVRLHRRGTATPLARVHGPDRRLGAWWLGAETARDYWSVEDAAGATLAIFRDLADGAWRAHGSGGLK